MAAISRDISDQKRAEQQILRAQRLETAGRISSQVAHDFNNLLAPLAGYPELIKLQLPERHPAIAYCDEMMRAARRMAEINTDLLTLGRRGHFTQDPVDLSQLVHDALRLMPSRPPSLKVETHLAADPLPVIGSAAQLLRVITNLVQNARDSLGDQGRVTITIENVYLDQPLRRYSDLEVGEYVRLEVADEGVGIAPEIQDRIFDVFFTTKTTDQQRGSGLGLSVVQAVVNDHQGYVDFTSEVGKGSRFSVYLPARRTAVALRTPGRILAGSESVMLVDDDSAQRRLLSEFLQTLGYAVEMAESGEEAVERSRSRRFDLVILDMVMPPGIDGAETYRRLSELHPGQRAILLSGFAESNRVLQAQELGAGAFLSKPVSLETFSLAVRKELDRPATPGSLPVSTQP
jgi:two-component system, cell cycle sensor histidine kinase and response regulator CckA